MPFGDDTAAASANARAGLGALSDFLYRNQVVKPQMQANTAATQAATAEQQQQTSQQAQTYQNETQPLQKLHVAAATREGQMDIKNLYMSTVQRPDVSGQFGDLNGTTDEQGNTIAGPAVKIPFDEAMSKGYIPDEAMNAVAQGGAHHDTFTAPVDVSRPFIHQPQAVQDAMVDQVIKANPSQIPMTKAEAKAALAANDFREATATLPPITPYTVPGGLGLTKLSGGPGGINWEAAQTGAQPIPGPEGGKSGYMMVNGQAVADPNAIPAKDVEQHQLDIQGLQKSQQRVQQIQDMLSSTPDLVGPKLLSGGSKLAKAGRTIGAYTVGNENYAKQKQLDMFLTSELLDTLGQVHIGRMTEMEWNQLKNNIPSQSSPKEVWDDYLGRVQTAIGNAIQTKSDILRQNGTPVVPGNPYSSQLPSVSPSTSVAPPETGRVGDSSNAGSTGGAQAGSVVVNNKAEAQAALKAGKTFIYKGVTYGR